jgi:hypothetical protein
MKAVYVLREDCHRFHKCESWDSTIIAVCKSRERAWKELKKAVRGSEGYVCCWMYEKDFEFWIKDVENQGLPLNLMNWDESEFEPDYEQYEKYSWWVTKYSILNEEEEEEREEREKKDKKKSNKKKTKKATKKKTKNLVSIKD